MVTPGTEMVLPSGFTNVIGLLKNIVELPKPAGSVADSENVTDCGPPLKLTVDGNDSPVRVGGVVLDIFKFLRAF